MSTELPSSHPEQEPLALLLLPTRLEDFGLQAHARDLLSIPRVIALEPSRIRTPRFMREGAVARQGSRLKFPGLVRLLVLYHPEQYPLARSLVARHELAELWYVAPDPATLTGREGPELHEFDELARDRSREIVGAAGDLVQDEPLRSRLRDLEVINPRPFVPGGRSGRRR